MSQQQLVSSVGGSSSKNTTRTSGTSLPRTESGSDGTSDKSALYSPPAPGEYSPPDTVERARKANYVAFLFRTPFAVDAYQLGYATGIREDYQLQQDKYRNWNVPVVMMDNEFRDPDIERYRDRFNEVTPKVAVFGDATTRQQARRYVSVAKDLRSAFPQMDPVIVPKCDCFDEIPNWVVLGRPAGGQCPEEDKPETFSSVSDWRGRRVHILGGSPQVQWAEIQRLTQPTLSGDPPADIVGMDWNGPAKVAYQDPPEYWKRPTDRDPTHYDTDGSLSIQQACRRSLTEIKAFWQERKVWPHTEPIDVYGPAQLAPDVPAMVCSGRHLETGGELLAKEKGHVESRTGTGAESQRIRLVQYEDGTTLAFEDEQAQARAEYRSGIRREHGSVVHTTETLVDRDCLSTEADGENAVKPT